MLSDLGLVVLAGALCGGLAEAVAGAPATGACGLCARASALHPRIIAAMAMAGKSQFLERKGLARRSMGNGCGLPERCS